MIFHGLKSIWEGCLSPFRPHHVPSAQHLRGIWQYSNDSTPVQSTDPSGFLSHLARRPVWKFKLRRCLNLLTTSSSASSFRGHERGACAGCTFRLGPKQTHWQVITDMWVCAFRRYRLQLSFRRETNRKATCCWPSDFVRTCPCQKESLLAFGGTVPLQANFSGKGPELTGCQVGLQTPWHFCGHSC